MDDLEKIISPLFSPGIDLFILLNGHGQNKLLRSEDSK